MDNALVAQENQRVIGKCNMRINPGMKPKEPTYQVVLDALALTTYYPAFLITAEVQGMYYKKNHDFVALIWENLAYQIDNKDTNKQDTMFYPRFTKIIIHHFLKKDKSISMRNKMFMHTARDDSLLGTMRFVSRHEDTQVYGAILPKSITNQAVLGFVAYKTYYAIASGVKPSKSKKPKTKSDSAISSEETPSKKKPTKAKKDVPSKKKPASKPKLTKKKAPVKDDRGKVAQVMELILNQGFLMSNNTIHLVQMKELWREDNDDDEDDTEDDEGNDDGDDSDGNNNDDDGYDNDNDDNDDNDSDHERTKLHRDKNPNLNQFAEEHEEEEEEENVDEFTNKEDDKENEEESDDGEELYKDVNVNLRQEDVEMTDADQGGANQHNVSQESGFEQEEEDAHVTLTTVHDTQKTKGLMQSSFVSSDFIEKLQNFENVSPDDNEIASLMDTTVRTEEPSNYTSTLFTIPITQVDQYAQAISSIPVIVDRYINKLGEVIHKAIQSHNEECREEAQAEKHEYIDLVDMSVRTIIRDEVKTQLPQILPKAVSDFATPVIERNVTESLEDVVLARSSSQPKSTYKAAASLSEYELTKILLDKMEESKSHLRVDYKMKLYDALKSSQEAESQKDPRSKEGKSSSSSKDTSHSHHKSYGKSAHVEEPSHTVDESRVQKNQEFDTGNNDEKPKDGAAPKNDWFKKPKRPLTLDPDWNKRQSKPYPFGLYKPLPLIPDHQGRQVIPQDYFINNDLEYLKGGSLSRKYSTFITKTKAATYEIKWIEDMVPNLWSPVKVVYNKHAYCVTRLKIMKRYDYGHLDKIEVHREDQQLYTFKEGDFPRLRLQDIEDMLLLLVQRKLTNLTIDECFDLNVALRMFTRRIVIQIRVEYLQLGVESYQNKINLTIPDTFRSNIRNKTAYTTYSDPQGVIYKDQNNKNRLMSIVELNKFSDGTLNDVRTALRDITSGIRMEYLPKRKWSGLDKRRARVMIHNINKLLFERRLIRNLEKFVGGREYGNDLRLLERTI
ncbi:hypothetical protein Tco_1376502 [Tanacetum coccineum]